MRQWADAIMVGGETVRQDNPSLTVRTPKTWHPQPKKFIWTSRSDYARELCIWADSGNPPEFVHPRTASEWDECLQRLGRRDVTALLIEGGGELAASVLRAGAVDKVAFFVAPKILGGRGSRGVVAGEDPAALTESLRLGGMRTSRVGEDILITGYPDDVHRSD